MSEIVIATVVLILISIVCTPLAVWMGLEIVKAYKELKEKE